MEDYTGQKTVDVNKFLKEYQGIACLCGSTKYFNEYMEAARLLTLQGWLFYTVGSYGHSFHKDRPPMTEDEHDMVKHLHFVKVSISDLIVIVSPDGYVGKSTKAEKTFAERFCGLPVVNFDGKEFSGEVDEYYLPHNFNKIVSSYVDIDLFVQEGGDLGI